MLKQFVLNFVKALRYRALPYFLDPTENNIEIIVTSPGGVGTTFLIKFLNDHGVKTNQPHNSDKLKHLYKPIQRKLKNTKFIYIIGNPIEISLSLLNRNFFKLHCLIHGNYSLPTNKKIDINSVIDSKKDFLNLNNLFKNWITTKNHKNKCLIIDFDRLWVNKNLILDFCGINTDYTLPEKKERNTNLGSLSKRELKVLNLIYEKAFEIHKKVINNGGFLIMN